MENNIKWKYIVYETTNLINNKIYVGVHQTKDPDIFDGYLGNGIYNTCPCSYEQAKTRFQCAVKKYGPKNFRRKTLAVFDNDEDAYALEEHIVNKEFLARPDVYNMALGGRCGTLVMNRIKAYRYSLDGDFIEEYESFADAGLKLDCDYSAIAYAVKYKTVSKNSLWSTDKVDKINVGEYNILDNHRKVVHLYDKSGKYLKTFQSTSGMALEIKVSASEIKEACIFGTLLKKIYYCSYIQADEFAVAKKQYIDNRTVYKYDGNSGKFIEEYTTQLEAEKKNKNSNITKSIRLKSVCNNGFFWGIEKLDNYNVPQKVNKKKPVGKFSLDGTLIETYESATKAANINGISVWKVLSGTNQTHKGHIYKYL